MSGTWNLVKVPQEILTHSQSQEPLALVIMNAFLKMNGKVRNCSNCVKFNKDDDSSDN